jgi:hypothetical protein
MGNLFEGVDLFERAQGPLDGTEPPHVPSKAIVVVHGGRGHIVYHHGTHIAEWIGDAGEDDTVGSMVADAGDDLPAGTCVMVWSGHVRGSRDYWGEYNAWLEGSLRPITDEEWGAFLDGEVPWDLEEVRALEAWHERGEQERAERETRRL